MNTKKKALLTGVTSGIGKEVALGLVRQNYTLHVIARNRNKFNQLKEQALQINRKAELFLYEADLSSVQGTTSILSQIKRNIEYIDLLYQSAGIIPGKIEFTEEGIEKSFAISYLTRYLILNELMPMLLKSREKLVFVVAGPGQNGEIFFDDINLERRKFKPMAVVKQFQQCNDAFLLYLSEKYRSESLNVYCYNPGLVDTNIHKSWPFPLSFIMKNIAKPLFMKSPEKAAEKPLEIISNPSGYDSVLIDSKGNKINPSKVLSDSSYLEKVIGLSDSMINNILH